MAFNWQPIGALGGRVPNQMAGSTPKNSEGLGVPWGQAMFNLPRYQMPGSNINFGGGFNMGSDMQAGPNTSQMGMAPGANIGNVRFSLTRQASSDPVQNIIQDIQNPLGGTSINFGNANAQPQAEPTLREKMMAYTPPLGGETAGQADNPYGAAMQLQKAFGVAGSNQGQPSSYQNDGTYGSLAAGLRRRMTGPLGLGQVFM